MSKVALAVFFTCTLPVLAQQGRGTIYGTVTDPSGASVAAAKVSIVDTDTNNVTNTETNASGFFTSPPLIVGDYQVTVDHPGFKKETRSGISLQVDQHAEIDVALQVGAIGESIQVTGDAPLVNTENASVGQVIENKRIKGRSARMLYQACGIRLCGRRY